MTKLDFDARYRVESYPGVAFRLIGYNETTQVVESYDPEIDCWLYDELVEVDTSMVVAVMVGDNRKHIIDVDELSIITEDEYCSSCGQIGCSHD